MDVILLERIEKLGQMGDVVKVKPGYARNFLLPRKKALRATKENREYFEKQRTQLEAINLQRRQEAEAVAERMQGLTLRMVRQAAETGQLYGSVTGRDVAEAIKEAGFTVQRQQVHQDAPIKTLGQFPVRVSLHPEVAVTVTVVVARSQAEADEQAEAAQAELLEQPEEFEAAEAPEAAEEAGEAPAEGEDETPES